MKTAGRIIRCECRLSVSRKLKEGHTYNSQGCPQAYNSSVHSTIAPSSPTYRKAHVDFRKLATTVLLSMAAVAQSLSGRAAPAPDYTLLGSDADAEGEEDAEGDYEMEAEAQRSEPVTQADKSDEDAHVYSEEEDDDEFDAASEVSDKVPRASGRRARNSDKDAALDDASEAEVSSAGDDDGSDKSSSEGESAAAPEWEGGSEGGEDGSVEVANRNNCV